MKAKVVRIELSKAQRLICISDIHGCLALLKKLLKKIRYADGDRLVLLGDLYTKGPDGHETLKYIIKLAGRPGVHVLRGNCDWEEAYLSGAERDWLNGLPHIIESENYVFVHGGVEPGDLYMQDAAACMKNDAFMEKGYRFDKYVVAGHWPTFNYAHEIPDLSPVINESARIISIDGGTVLKDGGQLNAFIAEDGAFSHTFVDDLPVTRVKRAQAARGGALNITWNDRFVRLIQNRGEFSVYRHLSTGIEIELANEGVWTDGEGNLCECDMGTDYCLPVREGEEVSVIKRFGDRIFAKKDGVLGWVFI